MAFSSQAKVGQNPKKIQTSQKNSLYFRSLWIGPERKNFLLQHDKLQARLCTRVMVTQPRRRYQQVREDDTNVNLTRTREMMGGVIMVMTTVMILRRKIRREELNEWSGLQPRVTAESQPEPRFRVFFLNFWRTSVPFVGPLLTLFWTSGHVCPGFQNQGGSHVCFLTCVILRFTSGATPADCVWRSAWEPSFFDLHTFRSRIGRVPTHHRPRMSQNQSLGFVLLVDQVSSRRFFNR